MRRKGFSTIVFIITIIVLMGIAGFLAWSRKDNSKNSYEPNLELLQDQPLRQGPAVEALAQRNNRAILVGIDGHSIQNLESMRVALYYYHRDYEDYPKNLYTLIPEYFPTSPDQMRSWTLHYVRCSSEDFHIATSLYFDHVPYKGYEDNEGRALATDLDKKVCPKDPIQFEDQDKCFPTDIGNHCLDLGKWEPEV